MFDTSLFVKSTIGGAVPRVLSDFVATRNFFPHCGQEKRLMCKGEATSVSWMHIPFFRRGNNFATAFETFHQSLHLVEVGSRMLDTRCGACLLMISSPTAEVRRTSSQIASANGAIHTS
jgi:hypothetical protein